MGTPERANRELWAMQVEVARACRVLAHRGLVEDVLGHVSARVGDDRVALRCRGPIERGLRFTLPTDVRLVDLAGRIVDGGDDLGFTVPNEAPIHLATMRRHPVVRSVVHAHPPSALVVGLASANLLAMFGSYDIPAARLAAGGIPVHPRSVLICDEATADEMLATMGDRPVCVLRGHGIVTTGASVPAAILHALAIERLARTALAILAVHGAPRPIPDDDLAALPDLGSGLNQDALWRFHLATLAADGWDLTGEQADGAG